MSRISSKLKANKSMGTSVLETSHWSSCVFQMGQAQSQWGNLCSFTKNDLTEAFDCVTLNTDDRWVELLLCGIY